MRLRSSECLVCLFLFPRQESRHADLLLHYTHHRFISTRDQAFSPPHRPRQVIVPGVKIYAVKKLPNSKLTYLTY